MSMHMGEDHCGIVHSPPHKEFYRSPGGHGRGFPIEAKNNPPRGPQFGKSASVDDINRIAHSALTTPSPTTPSPPSSPSLTPYTHPWRAGRGASRGLS